MIYLAAALFLVIVPCLVFIYISYSKLRKLEEAGRRFENRKLMETGKKIAEYAEQFEVDKLTGLLRELNLDFALTLNQH